MSRKRGFKAKDMDFNLLVRRHNEFSSKMNWTFSNAPQTSPGFVYFNNSDPGNQGFIPFSDSPPPPQHKFGPKGYSTPQHHQNRRGFNQQRNWHQNRFSGRGNRSFCSTNEPKFDNNYLIKTKFVHKSFLENPWEELEKKLEEARKSKRVSEGSSSQADTSGQKRTIDMRD